MKKENFFVTLLIILLLFTLPFKFGFLGNQEESLFPSWIPFVIGVVEFCSAIFLFFTKTRRFGALLSMAVFSGAVLAHILVLGIEYGVVLFPLALLGLFLSIHIHHKK